jgi:lysylphosphatidylglycerol synthetase-like protein (DUF2156 family)
VVGNLFLSELQNRLIGSLSFAALAIGGCGQMKQVMVALWFLVGLCLLIGGVMSKYTAYCLDIAGILVIILAIVLAMKKVPAK